MEKNNKSILAWTLIYILIMLAITGILNIFNLTFLNWIKYFSMIICFIGIILGTLQLLKKKKILAVIMIVIEVIIILAIDLYCILLFDFEEIVTQDGNKMVKRTHSVLLSNCIEYYDYKNFFVRSKQIRIYEAYNNSLDEWMSTSYYDENGNFMYEIKNENII